MNTTLYSYNILLEGEEKVFKIVPKRMTINSDLGSVRGIETEKVKQKNERSKNVIEKKPGLKFNACINKNPTVKKWIFLIYGDMSTVFTKKCPPGTGITDLCIIPEAGPIQPNPDAIVLISTCLKQQ